MDQQIIALAIGPGFVHTETTDLQRTDPMGVKWIPSSKELIDAGKTRPPEDCAKATMRMLEQLQRDWNGRIFEVDSDFDEMAQRAAEIREKDLYQMRWRRKP